MRCAVIMAGGSGTRLWPASRRARPKQFLALGGAESLLAATARRVRAAAGEVMVVTAAEQATLVRAELPGAAIVGEPCARNTAAALGLAAVHLRHRDADAVLGAFPADHHVGDEAAFGVAIERAFAAAEKADVIVTIGLAPSRAETGFGYLQLGGERPDLGAGVRDVARFVEKPDAGAAAAYVAGGRHLWNGGMFFVRAARLLDELTRSLPETAAGLAEIAAALARGEEAAARAAEAIYPRLPSVSIDHGVMEQAHDVVAVPADLGWSDVGSWAAVAELTPRDAGGNAVVGEAVIVDGAGNLVVTDPGTAVALVGVSGLAVVRAGDAVLVLPVARAQDVRAAVEALARRGLGRFT
ncbi:MAG TPA: sugar phosphate nucleotidyltransferase [Kofleriaceae bacterium]|nr:sugar phosphate nucleotidyltransferase [Kofleriaceae bacterium]